MREKLQLTAVKQRYGISIAGFPVFASTKGSQLSQNTTVFKDCRNFHHQSPNLLLMETVNGTI